MRNLLDVLSRMSTAVFFVVGLAFVSVAGTLLEQGLVHEDYLSSLGAFWFSVFSKLGLFNVFSTWWFLCVLCLTLLSVTVCLTRNSGHYYRMYKSKKMPSKRIYETWDSVKIPLEKEHGLLQLIGFYNYKKYSEKDGVSFYIRGRLNRLGYHAMHVGLVFLMIAGLLTGLLGFRDLVVLADGMTASEVYAREADGSLTPRELPFKLTSNEFIIDSYSSGMPKDFSTKISIQNGSKKEDFTVSVNHPVSTNGFMIYQSSYGDAGSLVNVRLGQVGKVFNQPLFVDAIINKAVNLGNGYGFKVTAVENFSVEPALKTGAVDEVENRGPYIDYELYSPVEAPVKLRSYMNYPEIIGMLDAEGFATPLLIGLPLEYASLWSIVRSAVQEDKERAVEIFMENARSVLKNLPEESRGEMALKALQAVKIQQAFGFPFLLELQNYEKKYYSLLQVSKDPGLWFFYLSSLFIMLGVVLMIYTRYAKLVIVKNNEVILVRSWQDSSFMYKINKGI